jgi:hypothetical protein
MPDNEKSSRSVVKIIGIGGGALLAIGVAVYFMQRSSAPGTTGGTVANAEWSLNEGGNAIDGTSIVATKQFIFADQKIRLDVSLTCIAKTRDLKIQIASYSITNTGGEPQGDQFVVEHGPVGRVKIGNSEPISISELFALDGYNNLISWNVRPTAQNEWYATVTKATHRVDSTRAEQDRGETLRDEGMAKIGGGNFLKAALPLVIEVQNTGGAEQITVPNNNDAINSVVEKCTANDLPRYESAPSEPSPPAPDQQPQPADQVNSTTAPKADNQPDATPQPKADDYDNGTRDDEKKTKQ